jgi:hypothetical protein
MATCGNELTVIVVLDVPSAKLVRFVASLNDVVITLLIVILFVVCVDVRFGRYMVAVTVQVSETVPTNVDETVAIIEPPL